MILTPSAGTSAVFPAQETFCLILYSTPDKMSIRQIFRASSLNCTVQTSCLGFSGADNVINECLCFYVQQIEICITGQRGEKDVLNSAIIMITYISH